MYKLVSNSNFKKKYKKLIKKNSELQSVILKFMTTLANDPLFPSIKTHKVMSRNFSETYSSRVTGDIRVIWVYGKEEQMRIIDLLDIGGHSGGNKVY